MQFLVLGPLRALTADGTDVTPRGQRALDLLAALLLRRRQPVDPQVLLELVWGDESRNLDVSAVHTVIARLRRALGSAAVGTTPRGYQLSSDWTVDEDLFTAAVTGARRTDAPTKAAREYAEALALWRADRAYDDVDETLVAAERSRLSELRANAREALAQALLDTGEPADTERALAEAEGLIALDPLRERAHELAMVANARLGRQADALAAYQRLRTLLREELGIDPGPRAAALHEQVLRQDLDLADRTPPAPAGRRRTVPPVPLTILIDRERELSELLGQLAQRRLVTLVGPGGVGKSRLLAEACQRLAAETEVGYVDLAPLEDPDESDLCTAIGDALGITHAGDTGTAERLAEALGDRAVTVFVDEAERALDATRGVISTLARSCPGLRVVVASRRTLDLVGERQLVVPPLACPAPDAPVEAIRAAPAVRLLVDRLGDYAPGLELDDEDTRRLARLTRRVDGLPLALELLARYADARSLAELESAATSLLDLTGEPERPERHQSLRDTVLWSVSALRPEERRVLRHLGVFAGAFDADAAAAVAGPGDEVPGVLHTLARDALLQVVRDAAGLHLRTLAVVRELSLEGLAESGELASARSRHRRWYADRWRGAPRSDELLHDVRRHYADFRQALRTSLEDGDRSTTADLAIALARLWAFTDMTGTGLRWLGRTLDSGLLSPVERARVLTMRAVLTIHDDPAAARADLEEAVPVLTEADEAPWLLTAHHNLALHHMDAGRGAEALAASREAAVFAERGGDHRRADALGVRALVQSIFEPTAARETIHQAWLHARSSDSTATMESVGNNLFLALAQLGDFPAAQELLTSIEERVGDDEVPLFLRMDQAWSRLLDGRPQEALQIFAFISAVTSESCADPRATELYAGAGWALRELGRPAADLLLAGTQELSDRVGTTLMPWQRERVAAAAAGRPDPSPGPGMPETTRDLGRRLARILADAANPQTDPSVSGSPT